MRELIILPILLVAILGAPKIVNASFTQEDIECIGSNDECTLSNGSTLRGHDDDEDNDNNNDSHEFNEPSGCYSAGYDDGQSGPFDSEVYHDNCEGEGKYLDGFIDGCMDEGNTKDVCESSTDA